MIQSLKMNSYEVWVHLGCSEEEQAYVQPVEFTIKIDFLKPVLGCETDQLNDSIDYVEMTEKIKKISTSKKFQLIEHLNFEVFKSLYQMLVEKKTKGALEVTIKKIRVPVAHLNQGVEFTCRQEL